jgi:hypothetical protein
MKTRLTRILLNAAPLRFGRFRIDREARLGALYHFNVLSRRSALRLHAEWHMEMW